MTEELRPAARAGSDENQLITERREKLALIRQQGVAFPNDFKPKHHAAELLRLHGDLANEALEPLAIGVVVAGRLMLKRVMGKASFATLQDGSGQIQLFVTRDAIGEAARENYTHKITIYSFGFRAELEFVL